MDALRLLLLVVVLLLLPVGRPWSGDMPMAQLGRPA
jgi:hypothetical protein